MTLLVATFAAIIATVAWYRNAPDTSMQFGTLCLMFWGASIMWFVDAVVEYSEMGAQYFVQDPADMLNDLFLGLCVVALGLMIWLVILSIKEPRGVVKTLITRNSI